MSGRRRRLFAPPGTAAALGWLLALFAGVIVAALMALPGPTRAPYAQLWVGCVLLVTFAIAVVYVPRHHASWVSVLATRWFALAVGLGSVSSFGVWWLEKRVIPSTPGPDPLLEPIGLYPLHVVALVAIPEIAHIVARKMPTLRPLHRASTTRRTLVKILRHSRWVVWFGLIPAATVVAFGGAVGLDIPSMDLRTDLSSWGFAYRYMVCIPAVAYLLLITLLLLEGHVRQKGDPALQKAWSFFALGCMAKALVWGGQLFWPHLAIWYPDSPWGEAALEIARLEEVPLFLALGYFFYRGFVQPNYQSDGPTAEDTVRLIKTYHYTLNDVTRSADGSEQGSEMHTQEWNYQVGGLLEPLVEDLVLIDHHVAQHDWHSKTAFRILAAIGSGRLERGRVRFLLELEDEVQRLPDNSPEKARAREYEYPKEILEFCLRLTDHRAIALLHRRPAWERAAAAVAAEVGLLPEDQAQALLDPTTPALDDLTRTALDDVRSYR